MNVLLMHRDRDFDWSEPLPAQSAALLQDLDLETLLDAMAGDHRFLREVSRRGLLLSLHDPAAIEHRQRVLADCLAQRDAVQAIYDVAAEALAGRRTVFPAFRGSVDSVLSSAVRMLEVFAEALDRLHQLTREHAGAFESEGFTRLFATIKEQLNDAYRAEVHRHLRELRFPRGVLVNARLGPSGTAVELALHRPAESRWLNRLLPADLGLDGYSFEISTRDTSGLEALAELRGRATNDVANAAAQAADHVEGFFNVLCAELGFYLSCAKLHEQLIACGAPVCFPEALGLDTPGLTARGLYDPCLALHLAGRPVGSDVDVGGRPLVMITGANQGGKSTFLRSVGVAQIMMQAGMFVAADEFQASVCTGLFTHFKREEDATLTSGKLDEELARMSAIVSQIAPRGLLLCNESFASTNEQEGSEIGRQVIQSLIVGGVRVAFVTHLYTLAHGFHNESPASTLFLRAERLPDGRRSFRLIVGAPEPTSYGEDAYWKIFGTDLHRGPEAPAR
jgi:hypothetical protein